MKFGASEAELQPDYVAKEAPNKDFTQGETKFGRAHNRPRASKDFLSRKKSEKSASEFLVDTVSQYPADVSILALGPLTNLALAIKRDSAFARKVKRVVVLGGAFFVSGNVNPAAEANVKEWTRVEVCFSCGVNEAEALKKYLLLAALIPSKVSHCCHPSQQIYGDPEAADVVFTCGADIVVVGINITTQVKFTDEDLSELRNSKGRYTQFICNMCKFYRDWHVKSDGVYGIFTFVPHISLFLLATSSSNGVT
ncbi:putative Uridine nucleosidase 1 [Cocos nucifera]|uniref:Putative Uridine nucleosidase 1 n=1 Tax=Cocos nucifera TaxID=13894 RepID=A0A8K0INL5_COCNU|nr:putative Uridine nucleosidase 1 [Cocos nucifera]